MAQAVRLGTPAGGPLIIPTVAGDDVASGSLTLTSTTDAVKNKIYLGASSAYDEFNTRLGIGRTDPQSVLEVVDTSAATLRGIVSYQTSTNTDGARLALKKSRGTVGVPTVIVNGDAIGRLVARAYDGAQFLNCGSIAFMSNGAVGINTLPTDILFLTTITNGEGTERARITSSGTVFLNARAGTTGQGVFVGTSTAAPNADVDVSYSSASSSTGDFPGIYVRNQHAAGVAEYRLYAFNNTHISAIYAAGPTTQFGTVTATATALMTTNIDRLTISADGTAFTLAQGAKTSGTPTGLTYTGAAHTGLAASVEAVDINYNLARTVEFATGALATQRAFRIQAPTYAFVGPSTLTSASTVSISGSPAQGTNATLTRSWALNVATGGVFLPARANAAKSGVVVGNAEITTLYDFDLVYATTASNLGAFPLLMVRNTQDATTSLASIRVEARSGGASVVTGQMLADGFGSALAASTVGIFNGTATNHPYLMYTNNTVRWQIAAAGTLQPFATATYDIGTTALAVKELYVRTIDTDGAQTLLIQRNNVTKITLDGTGIGFFGVAGVAQQTGSAWTNNVTAGGVADTLADFTSLTVYATDAATIRNNIYQIGVKIAQLNTAVRNLGLLT